MKRTMMVMGVCACAVMAGGWVLLDDAARGQDGAAPPDPSAMIRGMIDAGKPGPAHEVLDRLVGEWEFEFAMPGMEPFEGEAEFERELDGRCVRQEVEMEMTFGDVTIETEGIGVLTYNRHTGEYQSTWVDSLDPYMIYQTGKMEGDRLVLVGDHYQGGRASPMKTVFVFHGPDRFDMEFYSKMAPEGEWIPTGTITHTRD